MGSVSGTGTRIGAIIGNMSGGTVTNCYYLIGSASVGIGGNATDTIGKTETKTAEQFASGEVAYILGSAWGQNIDNGQENIGYPVISTATVYYGYITCATDVDKVYTNDTSVMQTKPSHSTVKPENYGNCTLGTICDKCGEAYGNPNKGAHVISPWGPRDFRVGHT